MYIYSHLVFATQNIYLYIQSYISIYICTLFPPTSTNCLHRAMRELKHPWAHHHRQPYPYPHLNTLAYTQTQKQSREHVLVATIAAIGSPYYNCMYFSFRIGIRILRTKYCLFILGADVVAAISLSPLRHICQLGIHSQTFTRRRHDYFPIRTVIVEFRMLCCCRRKQPACVCAVVVVIAAPLYTHTLALLLFVPLPSFSWLLWMQHFVVGGVYLFLLL